jgi:hypothetical protein
MKRQRTNSLRGCSICNELRDEIQEMRKEMKAMNTNLNVLNERMTLNGGDIEWIVEDNSKNILDLYNQIDDLDTNTDNRLENIEDDVNFIFQKMDLK